jgi:dihydrofolate synthase/folylpolyglutamate synthase
MNYAESVRYLYSLGNEVQTAKLGLERITRLLDALGNPQNAFRSVHVAGTNGKGSTCAMIEAGLRATGVRTGLYISPHLVEPTERIHVGGQPISQHGFADAFERVHHMAERMLASGELDFHPTYFETVTAMAFLAFAQDRVDTAVLEVGLGGRLDATNVVNPTLCVITRIDYDHQIFLGDTLTQIAGEKAGILKPGVPAVFSEQAPEAEAVLRAQAKGPYTFTRECPISNLVIDARGSQFSLGKIEITCPLAGEHQVENARTAALALQQLGPLARQAGARFRNARNHSRRRAQSRRRRCFSQLHPALLLGSPHLDRLWCAARQSNCRDDLAVVPARLSPHPDGSL